MSKFISTNIPKDAPEFTIMRECLISFGDTFRLVHDATMEKYVNLNNVYFSIDSENSKSVIRACASLHRIILNFKLLSE